MNPRLPDLVGEVRAATWSDALQVALDVAQATEEPRASHLLAQVLHETSGLRVFTENLNYSASRLLAVWPSRFDAETAQAMARKPAQIANFVYGDRLGNTKAGDGWRYRGRGLIQLTGRANYAAFSRDSGIDVESNPDRVLEPYISALVVAWYWLRREINKHADRDDLIAVTKAVNGGANGLEDRRRWLEALREPRGPDRIGDFEVLVLHGLTREHAIAVVDCVLAGRDPCVLGPVVASRTNSRKIDVRFSP